MARVNIHSWGYIYGKLRSGHAWAAGPGPGNAHFTTSSTTIALLLGPILLSSSDMLPRQCLPSDPSQLKSSFASQLE